MDINERSKIYADGKALSAINSAIEQAYIDGYNDGLRHLEIERLEAMKEGVEYKDLKLPSGTLWSSRYVTINNGITARIPFMEASKLCIPTKADYEELFRNCKKSYYLEKDCHGIQFTGINGEAIVIEYTNREGGVWSQVDANSFRFWLNEKEEKNNERKAASIRMYDKGPIPMYFDIFMGLKLPVMLVKRKY